MIAPNAVPQPTVVHLTIYLLKKIHSAFFPNLPALPGKGNHAADHCTAKYTSDECHKYLGFHPVLTSGIFTISRNMLWFSAYGFT